MRLNVDCAERAVGGSSRACGGWLGAKPPALLIGQSRGGELARVVAVRNPDVVSKLVMLGSPVLEPLSVGPAVLGAVRSVARWVTGVPGVLLERCGDGECCAAFREDLRAPLPRDVRAVAIYSRSDGIVSWRACLDPCARHVEVESSHGGMSVNLAVYRVSARSWRRSRRWTG